MQVGTRGAAVHRSQQAELLQKDRQYVIFWGAMALEVVALVQRFFTVAVVVAAEMVAPVARLCTAAQVEMATRVALAVLEPHRAAVAVVV